MKDDKPKRPSWMSEGRWKTLELFRETGRTGRTPKRRVRARPTAKIIPFPGRKDPAPKR